MGCAGPAKASGGSLVYVGGEGEYAGGGVPDGIVGNIVGKGMEGEKRRCECVNTSKGALGGQSSLARLRTSFRDQGFILFIYFYTKRLWRSQGIVERL